jgi:hypothetical protein
MSTFTDTYLAWRYSRHTMALTVGDRRVEVPEPVTTLLLAEGRHSLTGDPAHDLLLLEQDLRWETARLAGQLAEAAAEINTARAGDTAAQTATGWTGRRIRHAAGGHLADAVAEHATVTARHRAACDAVATVRAFIASAKVPDGWLAEATTGWQRSPEPPPWVSVFADETAFLDADARRSVPGWWGGSELGGVRIGWEWRRDRDDDDPLVEELFRGGPWWVAWLEATGEIYATRRSVYLPEQVWLLGRTFTEGEEALELLRGLESHMREPNSLLLLAQRVHEHETRRAVAA